MTCTGSEFGRHLICDKPLERAPACTRQKNAQYFYRKNSVSGKRIRMKDEGRRMKKKRRRKGTGRADTETRRRGDTGMSSVKALRLRSHLSSRALSIWHREPSPYRTHPRVSVSPLPRVFFILILHPFLVLVARARARRTRSLALKALIAASARLGTKAARRKMAQIRRRDPNCC